MAINAISSPVDSIQKPSCSLLQPAINISLQEPTTYILALPPPPQCSQNLFITRGKKLRETEGTGAGARQLGVTGKLGGARAENVGGAEKVEMQKEEKKKQKTADDR